MLYNLTSHYATSVQLHGLCNYRTSVNPSFRSTLLYVGEAGPQWPPVHSGFCIAWSQESFRLLIYFSVVNLLLLVIAFLLYFRLCNASALSLCNGS